MPRKSPAISANWLPVAKTEETSQWVVGLDDQLKQATHRTQLPQQPEKGQFSVCLTETSFWLIHSFSQAGYLAIRTCFDPQSVKGYSVVKSSEHKVEYRVDGALGQYTVTVEFPTGEPSLLRYTTALVPGQPFTVQAFPRDVYVLDEHYDPTSTEGMVYVTQSGPTAGLAYLSMTKPGPGTVLYFQNLTALNDYCQMTKTEPGGTVTAQWPEVGFTLPTSEHPLEAGKEIVLSDAFIYLSETVPGNEFEAADQFLEAIARIYKQLPKPDTTYYDWPQAAKRTVKALSESTDCGRHINKQFYLNAYVGATRKPPESMVQLAILVPLWEYQQWLETPVPLLERLQKNIPTFYDEKKATLMRWLPGESFAEGEDSEEEDPAKIDSWYLLHTLMNLGRLAEKGHQEAKELLFRSLDFVIEAAHRFGYNWPVFYDSRTLAIIKAETSEGRGGELDVAGLFTHVMLQAYEFTRDQRYLNEAKQSAERLEGKGFDLLYQSNITLMSALTLAKLWKTTGNRLYFDLSRLSIANLVARMWLWECRFGAGQSRSTFMGVAPLRDAEYLAAYEEAEIIATMTNYLKEVGTDVPKPVRVLFSEYSKYLLHRGRYYFPTELPPDSLSQQPREGRIIPDLPIPLEDLSTGWKQVGAVGQEVYGGALPYILATYAYKQFDNVPVMVYSDYPIYQADYQRTGPHSGYAILRLAGTADYTCRVRLLAKGRQLTNVRLIDEEDSKKEPIKPVAEDKTYQEYRVKGNLRLRVEWTTSLQRNES